MYAYTRSAVNGFGCRVLGGQRRGRTGRGERRLRGQRQPDAPERGKKGSVPQGPPAPNPLGSAENEAAAPRWLRGAGSR